MCGNAADDPSQHDRVGTKPRVFDGLLGPEWSTDQPDDTDIRYLDDLIREKRDAFGTGQPIVRGSQVVVAGEGMGTVVNTECGQGVHNDVYAIHIEGDPADKITCYPRELVVLYADIYAGIAGDPNA